MAVHGHQTGTDALRTLAGAALDAALAPTLTDALARFAAAAAVAFDADVVVIRIVEDGALAARAVHATSAANGALVEGSRLPLSALENEPDALHVPVRIGDDLVGSLELRRDGRGFADDERAIADAAADQLALVLRAVGSGSAPERPTASR